MDNSGSSVNTRTKANANSFPLDKFPPEIRDKVWEESISLERPGGSPAAQPASELPKVEDFGTVHYAQFYSLQAPAVAVACRESHAVSTRLQRKGKGKTLWERNFKVPVVQALDRSKSKSSMVPLLGDSPDNQLFFALDPMQAADPNLFLRGQGRRLLELLLAAKDNQIKVVLCDRSETFVVPDGATTPAANRWIVQTRLVSLSDMNVWEELNGIAAHHKLPWEFAKTLLDEKSSARKKIVDDAVRPLENLWKNESRRRKRAGMEELGPLPRIDVCVYVDVTQGGPVGMLGFKGVPDREAFNELIRWGVL